MIKYLYGKKEHLLPVYEGKVSPRFSDLGHYKSLENEMMRDEETMKSFSVDKNSIILEINGRALDPNDMTTDPIFSVPARSCYCLCLTSKKNDVDIYERFKADFCLAINIEFLVEYLSNLLNFALPNQGLSVTHNSIKYYDPYFSLDDLKSEELVFYKPMMFKPEAEYRIAIFSNAENRGFKTEKGVLPFTPTDESQHLSCHHKEPLEFWRDIFIEYYER